MRLPEYCPVLARPAPHGGYDIQVGLAAPVVLTDLSFDERVFVSSLEGGRPVSNAEAARFARVVATLTVGDAWQRPTVADATIAVHGCGGLGLAVATALGAGGWSIALADSAPIGVEPPGTYPVGARGTCAAAAAAVLAACGITARIGADGDVVVLVFTGAPDAVTVASFMRDASPHVLVACDEAGALVSHVVVPGATACSRCRELALTRVDAAWPYLSLQLGGSQLAARRPRVAGVAGPAAAARIAARVAGWLARGEAGVAERIGPDGSVTEAPIAPEAECGCGAAGSVGDEVAARRARLGG